VKIISVLIFSILFLLSFSPSVNATSSYFKYNNNPVFDLSPTGWDSKSVTRQNVIFDENHYKMYYAGSDGNKFQIGLATSPNGFSWTRHPNNPIITLPQGVNGLYDPMVIKKDTDYIMWYETQADEGSLKGFRFFRAISTDGIVWTTNPITPIYFQPENISESQTSPFVIYDKNINKYKMWYSSLKQGTWSISYAESFDGITWINNLNNPIITNDQPWEGDHVVAPTVIYDNNNYHLWYMTSPSDNIIYAYSSDGITGWVKPNAPINPILERSSNSFEGGWIDDSTVLKVNNSYNIWYSARPINSPDFLGFRIGLASSNPIVEPTPEPPKVTKVIFIPGLAGSWNLDAIMKCKSDSYSGSWTEMPKTATIFNPLLDSINATGSNIIPFYYDWRRDPRESAEKLKTFIENNTTPNEKVYLVGYSLGGLVGRAYIEKYKDSKIAKYISIGAPFQGALDAYPAWEGDKIVSDNKQWKYFVNIVLHFCKNKSNKNDRLVKNNIPSIQSLLPTFDYLRNWKSHVLIPINTMIERNNWLPNENFKLPFFGIPFKTIVGIGKRTSDELFVKQPNKWSMISNLWQDGEIIGKTHDSNDGDGTVLAKSATVQDSDTIQLKEDHTSLISSSETIQTIKDFFGLTSLNKTSLSSSESKTTRDYNPESALIIIGDPGFSIQITDSQVINDTNGLIYIPNLKTGEYNLRLIQKQLRNMKLHVFQFSSKGDEWYKEYNLDRNKDTHKKIRWDREKPIENPIN
jgi:predicted GH43/DUF377 family glycosyl hydrolase